MRLKEYLETEKSFEIDEEIYLISTIILAYDKLVNFNSSKTNFLIKFDINFIQVNKVNEYMILSLIAKNQYFFIVNMPTLLILSWLLRQYIM